MALASYFLGENLIDKMWFILSPQNPLKKRESLLPFHHRRELLNRAIDDDTRMDVSDIEKSLPLPSYTSHTMRVLIEKNKNLRFFLILGADNALTFKKWKDSQWLAQNFNFLIYPRSHCVFPNYGQNAEDVDFFRNFVQVDAPLIEISSSLIRNWIRDGKNVRHFMPEKAWRYLDEMNFYKKYVRSN